MRYFYSDPHFGHAKVLVYCPERKYANIEEMNEAFVKNWNDIVKPEDEVFCLGDFSMSTEVAKTITRRLNGIKRLILGNHDAPHPANKKARGTGFIFWTEEYKKWGWESVELEGRLTLKNGLYVRLYHMPYLDVKDLKQNHKQWRLPDDGLPLICGHIHQHWTMRWTREKGTKMLNVGVDRWDGKPVSEDEVCAAFEKLERPLWQPETEGRDPDADTESRAT